MLGTAVGNAEPRYDLVEDEEGFGLLRQPPQTLQESGCGRHHSHVAGDGLDDDTRDLVRVGPHVLLDRGEVVYSAISVSWAKEAVTPALSGTPWAMAPDPAATSSASAWP